MTKLISLRVVIAADDAVDLKDVKPLLQAMVAAGGTQKLGETEGRIHWGTVEVLQGPDRIPVRRNKGRAPATPSNGEQPDLVG